MGEQKPIRINKYLSELGYCSRRAADKLIEQGRITVNDAAVVMGMKVTAQDRIAVDGVLVNEIFKQPLFESAKYGVINLHSALLPKYRGLMPSFWVMRHNEEKTGVSVFFVDEGIDSGPIIVQKEVPLLNRTQAELIWELKYRGADTIVEACNLVAEHGKNTPTMANDEKEMTYYSRPTKEDVKAFKSIGKKFF